MLTKAIPVLLPIQHSSEISRYSHVTTQKVSREKKIFSISNANSDFFCPVSSPVRGWYVGVCVFAVESGV